MKSIGYIFAIIICSISIFAANASRLQQRTKVLAQRMRKNLRMRHDDKTHHDRHYYRDIYFDHEKEKHHKTDGKDSISRPQEEDLEKENHDEEQTQEISKAQKIEHITSGKGTWVNLWNYPKDTKAFISRLTKFKIDTIYLQVNRSTTDLFKDQAGVNAILKEAHANDIKVIGWSYCYLKDVAADAEKFIKVAKYISPDGESFDAMAADMEENTSNWAIKAYTRRIKRALPKSYPLIAIIYSPKIKQDYPWELVADKWDILMPMVYWHGLKNRNQETVYNFVTDSIKDLKRLSKKDDLNIHLITDGDRTSHHEVATSIKAALDHGGVNAGISIYPEHLASDAMLKKLSKFN